MDTFPHDQTRLLARLSHASTVLQYFQYCVIWQGSVKGSLCNINSESWWCVQALQSGVWRLLCKSILVKCTKWHSSCFCFVPWVYTGSRESVKAKRTECTHCTLAAFFTMVTLSNQAHSSGLTASRTLCARGPLSQALNHWAEILWQLVSTAKPSWTARALIDSHCASPSAALPLWTLDCFPSHFTYLLLPSGSRLLWFLMTFSLGQTTSSISFVNFTLASG